MHMQTSVFSDPLTPDHSEIYYIEIDEVIKMMNQIINFVNVYRHNVHRYDEIQTHSFT